MSQERIGFDPFEFAKWQLACMPEPTPWSELVNLPAKQRALTLIREREIPGLQSNFYHQALIVGALEQVSPEDVVCVKNNGIATFETRVPQTDVFLRAEIDLSTRPDRKPIFYFLCQENQPDLQIVFLGQTLMVYTPEFNQDPNVEKVLGLCLSLESQLPHFLSYVSCEIFPSKPLPQTPLKSVRDLDGRGVDKITINDQEYALNDGFSVGQLIALTQTPTTDPSKFLNRLASVVWHAYSNAKLLPISQG